jgi:hypothetical protein
MEVPGNGGVPSMALAQLPLGNLASIKGHRIVQTCNLTYCPTVTFVTIAAACLSAQRPLPAVVVRFVRGQADRDLKPTLDPKIPGFADRTGSLW